MTDIKTKKNTDLNKELAEKRKSLREFRFGVAGSKVKNIKEARNLRKGIARILTELGSRKVGA
jgi:ribosomal protein L29